MAIELRRRTWTVDEYHRMAEAGVLREDDRVELIEGEIIEMSPIGSAHARCVNRLTALLVPAAGGRAIVSVQNPVRLSPRSEPQPDLSLLRWRHDFYPEGPTPGDVLLVIEVAASSVGFDRRVKVPLYGRAGIPEVWIVDLDAAQVEVHTGLSSGTYREVRATAAGDMLEPPGLAGVAVDVGMLFS
ncbi:MAG: Uma2 family endonuclease [Actinomycetota bacterium]|nr:Uma2 family endonuclease [Actinomycetota bacterium]